MGRPKRPKCRLCLADGPFSKESHVFPRHIYARTQNVAAGGGGQLVVIDGTNARFSQDQLTEPTFLCDACELNPIGEYERAFSAVCLQTNGTFPALTKVGVHADGMMADASQLDVDKICRFAVSVVWRASKSRLLSRTSLGPYEEAARVYLVGRAPLPPRFCVVLQLFRPPATGPRLDRVMGEPESKRERGGPFHLHTFSGLGMRFLLFVGAHIPQYAVDVSLNGAKIVIVRDGAELTRALALASSSKPTASVARWLDKRGIRVT